jgi:putative sterol carrier protein
MASKDEILKGLDQIAHKLDDPKLKERFKNFNKTMLFKFGDVNLSYWLKFADGEVKEINEGKIDAPDVVVEFDSGLFLKILRKETNPINAYSAGKIKIKGEMSDLLKLQKLL